MSDIEGFIKTARGTGVLSVQSFINALLGAFIFIFMARILTQTEMGIYGSIYLVLSITTAMGLLGLDYAASRYIPYLQARKEHAKSILTAERIITIALLGGTVLMVCLYLLAQPFSNIMFQTPIYRRLFQIVSPIALTFVASYLITGFLQGFQRFAYLAFVRFISQIARLALTVALLLLGFGVVSVFLGWASLNIVAICLAAPIIGKFIRQKKTDADSASAISIRELLDFSLPLMGVYTLTTVLNSVDQFIVLGFIGVEALGTYFVVTNAAYLIILVLGMPLTMTMTPSMSETHGRIGIEGVSKTLTLSSRYIAIFFIPTTFFFAALAPIALFVLGGMKYVDASFPLTIICLSSSTYSFSAAIIAALTAIGRTKTIITVLAIASMINLTASITLSTPLGLTGVATARSLMYISMLIMLFYIGPKHLKVKLDRKAITGSLIGSTIMASITYLFALYTGFSIYLLPAYILTAIAVYILVLKVLKILTTDDIKIILRILPGGRRLAEKTNTTTRLKL